jgi:hypothetical protein
MTGHSEQLNELAAALAKAQAELNTAEADGVGHVGTAANGRSYRYATLASVWGAIRKPLSSHGLALAQTCEPGNRGELRLTTTLLHESGQWISGTEIVPMPVQTPQGYGSTLTYARRYGLAAMVGVCVDDDDDAAAASQVSATQQRASAGPPSARPGGRRDAQARDAQEPPTRPTASRKQSHVWRQLPYNEAKEAELKLFAREYAKARGLETVTSDDIRRDFGVSGKLVEYFGTRTLGEILERATRVTAHSAESGEDARDTAAA